MLSLLIEEETVGAEKSFTLGWGGDSCSLMVSGEEYVLRAPLSTAGDLASFKRFRIDDVGYRWAESEWE